MERKKRFLIGLLILMIAVLSLAGCEKPAKNPGEEAPGSQLTDQQGEKEPSSEDKDPQTTKEAPVSSGDKASSVNGIYYSASGEKADILILDETLEGREILLGDEVRVFFTDKPMNSLTELEIKEKEGSLFVEKARSVPKISFQAKYSGMSDSSSAEFQVGERGFVLLVAEELTEKLSQEKAGELMDITIEQNETEQANPVLIDFK